MACGPNSSIPVTRVFQSLRSDRSLRRRSSSRMREVNSFADTRTVRLLAQRLCSHCNPRTILPNVPSILINVLKLA